MNVIIFGAAGQLGCELIRAAQREGFAIAAFSRAEVDITRADQVDQALQRVSKNSRDCVALNAAAYTAVDRAETDTEAAYATNACGPRALATGCAALQIPFIHFSTDYVFDGRKRGAYVEDDAAQPLNVYGASKLAGENAVRETWPQHLIVRSSSVFSRFGQNFVKTMLRLGREGQPVRLVSDQLSGPTPAADIASAAMRLVRHIAREGDGAAFGTYHLSGTPALSWYEFAQEIFRSASRHGAPTPELEPVSAAQYGAAAKRPARVVLDCRRVLAAFDIAQPDWRRALDAVIDELLQPEKAAR